MAQHFSRAGRQATVIQAAVQGGYDSDVRLEVVRDRLRSRFGLDQFAHQPVAPRLAAVLVPLFASTRPGSAGELRVVLTRRSSNLSSHQGEVCLPGGKRDPGDVDDVGCALREANEELGIPPERVEVLGLLPPLLSKHYLSVRPVAAIVPPVRALHAPQPNPAEVAEVFDVPLSIFLSSRGHSAQDITWQAARQPMPHWKELQYRVHSFEYENHTIWGLTAAILIKVAKAAFNREPTFMEHAPKGLDYTNFWHDGQRLRVHTLAGPPPPSAM